MLEILIVIAMGVTLLVIGDAVRRYPKRGSYSLRQVRLAASLPVGALDTLDVGATQALTNASTDPYRLISIIASYNWSDVTTNDDGMTFGVAHSDYTSAEIEECIEAQASIDRGDKFAQEQANRLVRTIGTFQKASGASDGEFNSGKMTKIRLNWKMNTGDTLNLWFRNGSDTIYTTGSDILVNGSLWVKD